MLIGKLGVNDAHDIQVTTSTPIADTTKKKRRTMRGETSFSCVANLSRTLTHFWRVGLIISRRPRGFNSGQTANGGIQDNREFSPRWIQENLGCHAHGETSISRSDY